MRKNVKVRVICLAIALVVLGGAVTAAAIMGSPYEILKNTLLDAVVERNVTTEMEATMSINGKVIERQKSYSIVGDNGSLNYSYDSDGVLYRTNYYTAGLNINDNFYDRDDQQWHIAYVYPATTGNISYSGGVLTMFNAEDRNSAQVRLLELLADALVGDLKNNITMSVENGVRLIQGTLTESQIPELAKAAIDVFIEQSGYGTYETSPVSFNGSEYIYESVGINKGIKTVRTWKQPVRAMTEEESIMWARGDEHDWWADGGFYGVQYIKETDSYYINSGPEEMIDMYERPATRADYGDVTNPMQLPLKNLTVTYAHGKAEIDADENLTYLNALLTATMTDIFGEVSTIEVDVTIRFTDIGTSNAECPIPGAVAALTADKMKERFGSANISVYFLLNEDGSINEDSITTTYPGELTADREAIYAKYGESLIFGNSFQIVVDDNEVDDNEVDNDGDYDSNEGD